MLDKKYQASVLVVTIMILGIVLATALSIAAVSNKERSAAIGSSQSNKAYQNADSGVESVLYALLNHPTDTVAIATGLSCTTNSKNHAVVTGATGTGYTVELKKANDIDSTDCGTTASDIASIKSIGTAGSTQRAIGAPVVW